MNAVTYRELPTLDEVRETVDAIQQAYDGLERIAWAVQERVKANWDGEYDGPIPTAEDVANLTYLVDGATVSVSQIETLYRELRDDGIPQLNVMRIFGPDRGPEERPA